MDSFLEKDRLKLDRKYNNSIYGDSFSMGLKQTSSNTPEHYHDCCEIELVLSGIGENSIGGERYVYGDGDIYFLTDIDSHGHFPAIKTELYNIMLDEKYISPEVYKRLIVRRSLGKRNSVRFTGERFEAAKALFSVMEREYLNAVERKKDELFELTVKRLVDSVLLLLLMEADGDSEFSEVSEPIIARAIMYIHAHQNEPVTLNDAAASVHLSAGYFSELFSKTTGQTFKSYVTDLRIRNACRMLANSDMSVTDICYECGFESFSNFMRTFKRRIGTSPLKFRKDCVSEKMQ